MPSGSFCTTCGQPLADGSYCGNCGSRVVVPSAEHMATAQQASPLRSPRSKPSNTVAPPDQTAPKPQPARASRKRMSVAWTLGLLISAGSGLLIGYLVFHDDTGSADPAMANINFACDLADRISQTHGTEDDWGRIGEDPAYQEVLALGGLIEATGIRDQQYEHWGDLGRGIASGVTSVNVDQVNEGVSSFVRECDQL